VKSEQVFRADVLPPKTVDSIEKKFVAYVVAFLLGRRLMAARPASIGTCLSRLCAMNTGRPDSSIRPLGIVLTHRDCGVAGCRASAESAPLRPVLEV
jgi:hypothetical protein